MTVGYLVKSSHSCYEGKGPKQAIQQSIKQTKHTKIE
jgi:hypothetical protein